MQGYSNMHPLSEIWTFTVGDTEVTHTSTRGRLMRRVSFMSSNVTPVKPLPKRTIDLPVTPWQTALYHFVISLPIIFITIGGPVLTPFIVEGRVLTPGF